MTSFPMQMQMPNLKSEEYNQVEQQSNQEDAEEEEEE